MREVDARNPRPDRRHRDDRPEANPDGRDLRDARHHLDLLQFLLLQLGLLHLDLLQFDLRHLDRRRREMVHHFDRPRLNVQRPHHARVPQGEHPSSDPVHLPTGDPTQHGLLLRLGGQNPLDPHQFPNPEPARRAGRHDRDHRARPGPLHLRRDDPDRDDGKDHAALASNRG